MTRFDDHQQTQGVKSQPQALQPSEEQVLRAPASISYMCIEYKSFPVYITNTLAEHNLFEHKMHNRTHNICAPANRAGPDSLTRSPSISSTKKYAVTTRCIRHEKISSSTIRPNALRRHATATGDGDRRPGNGRTDGGRQWEYHEIRNMRLDMCSVGCVCVLSVCECRMCLGPSWLGEMVRDWWSTVGGRTWWSHTFAWSAWPCPVTRECMQTGWWSRGCAFRCDLWNMHVDISRCQCLIVEQNRLYIVYRIYQKNRSEYLIIRAENEKPWI